MVEFLAFLGNLVGGATASILWIVEEPECPKSLIK